MHGPSVLGVVYLGFASPAQKLLLIVRIPEIVTFELLPRNLKQYSSVNVVIRRIEFAKKLIGVIFGCIYHWWFDWLL